MGDAAGIGPEIIVKLFAHGLPCPALVYGDAGILNETLQRLGLADALSVELISEPDQLSGRPGTVPVLNRWQALPDNIQPGVLSAQAGRGAYRSEEHTSEPQALMRNTYAVYSMKKQTRK